MSSASCSALPTDVYGVDFRDAADFRWNYVPNDDLFDREIVKQGVAIAFDPYLPPSE